MRYFSSLLERNTHKKRFCGRSREKSRINVKKENTIQRQRGSVHSIKTTTTTTTWHVKTINHQPDQRWDPTDLRSVGCRWFLLSFAYSKYCVQVRLQNGLFFSRFSVVLFLRYRCVLVIFTLLPDPLLIRFQAEVYESTAPAFVWRELHEAMETVQAYLKVANKGQFEHFTVRSRIGMETLVNFEM